MERRIIVDMVKAHTNQSIERMKRGVFVRQLSTNELSLGDHLHGFEMKSEREIQCTVL
jgi:hypothetical protein